MTDETGTPVPLHLGPIDATVARPGTDFWDVETRMTGIDEMPVGLDRPGDLLEHRVERIERRLDLVERPH